MDIDTVTSYRRARTRDDLLLAPGEVFIAGGTWLMSEPQPEATGFVDLTTMPWPDIEVSPAGLRISATCTITRLVNWSRSAAVPAEWTAASLIAPAAEALLASTKIWHTATVGGNICQSFAAGSMISLAVALDGVAEVWRPDAADRHIAVADLITGNARNALAPGEVLRAIELPAAALRSRSLLRKIALAEYGRSGAVVTGRVDDDASAVFTITAATLRPVVLHFESLPDASTLADAVGAASGYYTDPLGAADWRRGVSVELARRIRDALEAA